MVQSVFSVIDGLQSEYCGLWERVCSIESPTGFKQGVDEVGEVFLAIARRHGWQTEICEHAVAGNAICITMNPEAEGAPVVFSGHIDTVHPVGSFGTPAVRRDGEKLYGPGVTDCKGGVVAGVLAMAALETCGFRARPVKLIIQTDEETSSKTSDKQTVAFMVDKARGAAAFLNTECIQGNTAVLVRKGILRYRFVVTGKAVHSAKCTQGASAICEAAHKIIALEAMKDEAGLTCNCGVIQGGTTPNTVPESCEFVADIRFVNEEQCRQAIEICRRIAAETSVDGCTCRAEQFSLRPAMPLVDRNVALLAKMNEIYAACGLPVLERRECLSGSDAAYTTLAGIPTVDDVGVDGGRIHSLDEFAYLASLAQCAKRLAAVAVGI